MSADTSSFFGSSIPSIKFEVVGDSITGTVTAKELRQQTDLDSGDLLYWNDGRPKMMAVITLQSDEADDKDAEDEGKRNLFIRGLMQQAFREAIHEAGQTDLLIGNVVKVTFSGERPPARKGLSGLKEYKVTITK